MLLILAWLALPPMDPGVSTSPSTPAERGAQLYRAAGCVGCHSPPGREHLSGGRDNPTAFGTFYAPNISPHPADGIGGWTEADFVRAMREGVSPEGRMYWPTFPTMAYTHMSDADLHALWEYLRTQPAVPGTVPPHQPRRVYSLPGLLRLWRAVEVDEGPLRPDPTRSEQWNQGAYLVRAVTYCDQCHTPRNRAGMLQERRHMGGGGNPGKAEVHPNLTPDPTNGLPDWTEGDLVRFLRTGQKPDGSFAREDQVMAEKVRDSTRYLSEAELRAIAVYVLELEPVDYDPFTGR